jgi:serine/threonine protein kinase
MPAVQSETKIGIGTLLVGKYRVISELGRGGMAAVYEAENLTIGKKLAVKVLAAELANSAIVIERFFREARAAASVKSPHIVEVYDSGRLEDGRPPRTSSTATSSPRISTSARARRARRSRRFSTLAWPSSTRP